MSHGLNQPVACYIQTVIQKTFFEFLKGQKKVAENEKDEREVEDKKEEQEEEKKEDTETVSGPQA